MTALIYLSWLENVIVAKEREKKIGSWVTQPFKLHPIYIFLLEKMGLFANLKSRVASTLEMSRVRTWKQIVFYQKSGVYLEIFLELIQPHIQPTDWMDECKKFV